MKLLFNSIILAICEKRGTREFNLYSMEVSENCIIISSLKYGDNAIIFKGLTKTMGLKSFILKSAYSGKPKKSIYIFPLNQIIIQFNPNQKSNLLTIEKISEYQFLEHNRTDFYKSSIVLFMADMLNSTINEHFNDGQLYLFLNHFLKELNHAEHTHYLPLKFMKSLSHFLGIYPAIEENRFFNLKEGVFETFETTYSLNIEESQLWFKCISGSNDFSRIERQILMEHFIHYFSFHFPGFKKPLSYEILKAIMD